MSKEGAIAMISGEAPVAPAAIPVEAPAVPQQMESSKLALLAKKESQIVKEREIIKREKEATAKERAEYQKILDKAKKFEETRTSDPIRALRDIGFSETEIFNYLGSQQKKESTPEEIARNAALEEIKKNNDAQAKVQAEVRRKENEGIIQNYKKSISQTMQSDKEKFKINNLMGPIAEEYAFMMAEQCVKDGQEPPTAKEAAEWVEELLRQQYQEMKNILEPAPAAQETTVAKKPIERTRTLDTSNKTPPTPPKTLTNRVAPNAASTAPKKNETPTDKRERLKQWLATGVKPT